MFLSLYCGKKTSYRIIIIFLFIYLFFFEAVCELIFSFQIDFIEDPTLTENKT